MSGFEADFDQKLDMVRTWLDAAQHVTLLSGAGVSEASGVPTFRDTHSGYWAQFDPHEMASEAGFRAHPQRVWQWYAYRRALVAQVQPNAAHFALAHYAHVKPGKLRVITQNVDGLHQRAGSHDAICLHGDLMRNQWLNKVCPQCHIDAALALGGEPPTCSACGNPLRPGVVRFGEHFPAEALAQAEACVNDCEVMLVVGTSGVVYPAAALVLQAHQRGAKIVIINTDATALDMLADILLPYSAAHILPLLLTESRLHPAANTKQCASCQHPQQM